MFEPICEPPVENNGLIFGASNVSVAQIHAAHEYGGTRVLVTSKLGTAILRLRKDVGFEDVITPPPAAAVFLSILKQTCPRIRVYFREAVVAEKFEAMLLTLEAALHATLDRRGIVVPQLVPVALTAEFAADANHVRQWTAFCSRVAVEAPPALRVVIERIAEFVMRSVIAAATGSLFDQRWTSRSRWKIP